MKREGRVYLVGAGPGDPELMTVKARRLLDEADVVVYDRLVSADILKLVPAGTARIFVGKSNGCHAFRQSEINDLLVRLARTGRRVLRLKGGDPLIFGRGSEEAHHLTSNQIPFEIVPGITAATGCAAALGIPLTHRGVADGLRFVTGHGCDGTEIDLDWSGLADPDTTLVVYMGMANSARISSQLIAAGRDPETPALAVSNGTTEKQATCRTTIAALPDALIASGLESPVLIFIGRAVGLTGMASAAGVANDRSGHG